MSPERLNILYVSPMPASPPRFGAQARMHGLMTQLARRHDADSRDAGRRRVRRRRVPPGHAGLLPRSGAGPATPHGRQGLAKRLLQVRSLASTRSFERLRVTLPALQQTLDRILRARRFDIVNLEFPYLGHCRTAPGSARAETATPGRGLARDRLRPGAAVRPRRRQPGPPPLCRGQLAQAATRGVGDLSRRRRRLRVQRGG